MTVIEGTITIGGVPARIATVELFNDSGDCIDQVRVDDMGHYGYHLAPGNWSLNVYDARGNRVQAKFTLGEGEKRTLDIELKKGSE